ncbi:hypothetical protein CG747_36970 [Streptomyces sp. CB02959]|nr:hypothetical protein CG747_36970 [Streptomyces sp. CB02959]
MEAIDEVMATLVLRRAARSSARLASSRPARREAAVMVASMRRHSVNRPDLGRTSDPGSVAAASVIWSRSACTAETRSI